MVNKMAAEHTSSFLDDFVFECLQAGKSQGQIVDGFMAGHADAYEAYLESRSGIAAGTFEQKSRILDIGSLKSAYVDALGAFDIDIDKPTSNSKTLRDRIMGTKVNVIFRGSSSDASDSEDLVNIDCVQILNKISLAGGSIQDDFVDFFYALFFHEMSHKLDDYLGLIGYSEQDSPDERWHNMSEKKERFAEGMAKLLMEAFGKKYEGWRMAYEADAGKLKERESYRPQIAETIGHGFRYKGIFKKAEKSHPLVKDRCAVRAMLYEDFGEGIEPYLNPNTETEIKEILAAA
jgi:hypothetical protein